jgi:hypothetical protein
MSENGWLGLAGMVGVAIVLVWMIYWIYRMKVLEREERRLMIERGITPPPPQPQGWPAVRAREQELRFQERRLLIEKGLDPGDPDVARPLIHYLTEKRTHGPENTLRHGLVTLAIGLGLLAPYTILRWTGAPVSGDSTDFALFLAVLGPLVTLYGAANLLYYGLTKNRRSDTISPKSQDSRSGS